MDWIKPFKNQRALLSLFFRLKRLLLSLFFILATVSSSQSSADELSGPVYLSTQVGLAAGSPGVGLSFGLGAGYHFTPHIALGPYYTARAMISANFGFDVSTSAFVGGKFDYIFNPKESDQFRLGASVGYANLFTAEGIISPIALSSAVYSRETVSFGVHGGIDWRIAKWIYLGIELAYTYVPGGDAMNEGLASNPTTLEIESTSIVDFALLLKLRI